MIVQVRPDSPPTKFFFGRDRPLAGLPYLPPRECEDASAFIKRQAEVDAWVAHTLNEKHRKEAENINKNRSIPSRFEIGQKVWYRRPENSGTKVESLWLGPCLM